jgi:hypothetical protein
MLEINRFLVQEPAYILVVSGTHLGTMPWGMDWCLANDMALFTS